MTRVLSFFLFFILFPFSDTREPLQADFSNSAAYRWLNKEVLEQQLLDNMENIDHWITFTKGAQQVVDARIDTREKETDHNIVQMTLTGNKKYEGEKSLCVRIPTSLNIPGPKSGRGWGTAGVRRTFDGENWTGSNRISLWIFPECPGFYINWLELRIYNDGNEKLPALYGQEGETSLLLRNNEWNHVVWEIGNVARDRVTSLEISYYLSGNEPEAADTATYYFDDLQLQKVVPDYIEGWEVWSGRIAYSHTGYQSGAVKTAIANGMAAEEFSIINLQSGETVLTKPVETVSTHLGTFQVMDFTEVEKEGSFIIKAGSVRTQPFSIQPDVWKETILKALNFFYVERCGMVIPGVHGNCHRDWRCVQEDNQIIINGGWHDAGDLTQGLGNTAEIVYAMFELAERLKSRSEDIELYERLMEEAQWGLDWIMKTSFRNGFRNGGSISSRRTNGIIGDFDDVISTARNSPMDHFDAASAEAIAYRLIKDRDSRLAHQTLMMAEEDWGFAIDGLARQEEGNNKSYFRGTFDSDNIVHEMASAGIRSAVDLWKATHKTEYRDKAVGWANIIINSQQRSYMDWDVPLAGFFYTSPEKEHIMHYVHRGREQAPITALTHLCEVFPDHPDWMTWYAAVALHAEYLKTISTFTDPFGVFPASIYADDQYVHATESRRESFRKQVLNGIPLGKGKYLRLFPVWMDYRGHFGTILPQAKAIASAAHLRNDLNSLELAQHQLEWVMGRNPFSQSSMWGEGYDFPPLYTPLSGHIVGGLPVGIQTRKDQDVPYWPVQNSWTYKEIWGYPVMNWISLMKELHGVATLEGMADSDVLVRSLGTGLVIRGYPDTRTKKFSIMLPQGEYMVRSGNSVISCSFLPGVTHYMDMRRGRGIDFNLTQTTKDNGEVRIQLTAKGEGNYNFTLRTYNLTLKNLSKHIILKEGETGAMEWRCHVLEKDIPWIAVVVPNDQLLLSKEITNMPVK